MPHYRTGYSGFSPATFGVMTRDGVMQTMYKPNPAQHKFPTNWDYFLSQ